VSENGARGSSKPGGRYGARRGRRLISTTDGWPDIYVACDQTPSLLFHQPARRNIRGKRGVRGGASLTISTGPAPGRAWGVAYSRISTATAVHGPFAERQNFFGRPCPRCSRTGRRAGFLQRDVLVASRPWRRNHLLGWESLLSDFDDDGWKDLILANGHIYPEVGQQASIGGSATCRRRWSIVKPGQTENLPTSRIRLDPALSAPRPFARALAVGDVDGERPPRNRHRQHETTPPSLLKNQGAPRQNLPFP